MHSYALSISWNVLIYGGHEHPWVSLPSYLSAVPFRNSTNCPRCGSVFRADCDRGVALSGVVQSPQELSICRYPPSPPSGLSV